MELRPWFAPVGAVLLGLGALSSYTLHGNTYPCAGPRLCSRIIHFSPLVKAAILTLAGLSFAYAGAVWATAWQRGTGVLAGLLGVVALGYAAMWLDGPGGTSAGILSLLGGVLLLGSVSGAVSRRLRRVAAGQTE